jgi:superfamily II DNA or RNA helicase
LAQLSPETHVRGQQFEQLCKWLLQNDPVYARQLTNVWLWKEWPGRWGVDAGIDLVAATATGAVWAVQAKAYDSRYSITKADVDTFLSESSREQFSFRLLIATTDHVGETARRTLIAQEKPVHLLLRSSLEAAQVSWPASPEALRPARPIPKELRPHQVEAVAAICGGLEDSSRGQALMACGTGKTLVALAVAEALDARRTLVLVPSLALLGQSLREWLANCRRPFTFLPVCSDETVASEDSFTQEVSELGFPTTTDPSEVVAFLAGSTPAVVFATYQSSPCIAQAHAFGAPAFDLVIADEAHRCAGPAAGVFATILDEDAILSSRRLFMTATPRYFTDRLRREAESEDYAVASMDDEESFGSVFHRLSFSEALTRDLLSDYQVVVVGIDDETCKSMVDQRQLVSCLGPTVLDAQALATRLAVGKAIREWGLRRVVTFHGRVKGAREFANSLPAVVGSMSADLRPDGTIAADWVSGEMSAGKRDVILARFRDVGTDDRAVLSNARCLAEGVDVPALDGVVFVDPRRSQIDIVQAVGRAIRKAPNKKLGTVVIPVAVGATDDPQAVLEASVFKPVWDVLLALRAHDDVLAEELDSLRRELGRLGGSSVTLPSKLHLDLPTNVGDDFARALALRIVEQATESWEFWFGLLTAYVDREGTAQVPIRSTADGYALGRWVASQRTAARHHALAAHRIARLDKLPGWTWDPFADRWEEGFERLLAFTRREGLARPSGAQIEDGFPLGQWAGMQRTASAKGYLQPARRARLQNLPGWSWDTSETEWEEAFQRLTEFANRESTSNVPSRHVEAGFALGHWVSRQRGSGRAGQLDEGRRIRLEALPGWQWDLKEAAWEDAFSRLERFAARTGHAAPTVDFDDEQFKLGQWLNVQRVLRQAGLLDPARSRRLAQLPGWRWAPHAERWEQGYAALRRYVAREGHARVTERQVEDEFPLGRWVALQRTRYRSRTRQLVPERARLLEALPSWTWNPSDAIWEQSFEVLLHFVQREGHARPTRFQAEAGFRLGHWVSVQRVTRARGRLSDARTVRLEALPGWTWDASSDAWESAWRSLIAFVEREGHARPKVNHVESGQPIGRFVSAQRTARARGKLDPERARRLEGLAGWTWDPSEAFWEDAYNALLEFAAREGHAKVPSTHLERDLKLGSWVGAQRVAYRRGSLHPDRRARLEGVQGWLWDVKPRRAAARAQ